jgi:hypothetical protein
MSRNRKNRYVASKSDVLDQNCILDRIANGSISSKRASFHPAVSLHPGEAVMLGCVLGNVESIEIRDSWRPTMPVAMLPAEELDSNPVVFVGRLSDLEEEVR